MRDLGPVGFIVLGIGSLFYMMHPRGVQAAGAILLCFVLGAFAWSTGWIASYVFAAVSALLVSFVAGIAIVYRRSRIRRASRGRHA